MEELKQLLTEAYNLQPRKIIKIKKAYKIWTQDGKIYGLKEYIDRPSNTLEFQMEVLKHFQESGFHTIQTIIPANNGQLIVKNNKHSYVLSEWINGIVLDFSKSNHLLRAAEKLAQFHNTSTNLSINNDSIIVRSSFFQEPLFFTIKIGPQYHSKVLERLFSFRKMFPYPELTTAIERFEDAIYSFPKDEFIELYTSEKEANSFVHGDYNFSNLILHPNNDVFVIDLDNANFNIRVTDLIFLLQLHMGSQGENIIPLLKAYHQVRPLSPLEFSFIKSQLLLPGRVYWKLRVQIKIHNELPESFINQYISPMLKKELYDSIKKLSYKNILP